MGGGRIAQEETLVKYEKKTPNDSHKSQVNH
jgi:hypothetical protein